MIRFELVSLEPVCFIVIYKDCIHLVHPENGIPITVYSVSGNFVKMQLNNLCRKNRSIGNYESDLVTFLKKAKKNSKKMEKKG